MDPSERIDQLIAELTDWRGKTLAHVRKAILDADLFEGDRIDEPAFTALIRAALAFNQARATPNRLGECLWAASMAPPARDPTRRADNTVESLIGITRKAPISPRSLDEHQSAIEPAGEILQRSGETMAISTRQPLPVQA